MDIVIRSQNLPQDDGFALIENEMLVPGGSAANVSVALHLLGADVWQTGKIGDDRFGIAFRDDLVANGINVDLLVVKKGGATLHTYILTTNDGQHCIFANLGDAVANLEVSDLPQDALNGFSCFYTDMFSPRASLWLAKQAVTQGIPVVYNMQCTPSFMAGMGVEIKEIEQMLSLATIVIGGRDSYRQLTVADDYTLALPEMLAKYHNTDGLVCSLGSQGAAWLSHDGWVNLPAFSVEVVDSTGAGDCFAAGLIYDYFCCGKKDKTQSMLFASAVAALKCQVAGPRSKANFRQVLTLITNKRDEIHNKN